MRLYSKRLTILTLLGVAFGLIKLDRALARTKVEEVDIYEYCDYEQI